MGVKLKVVSPDLFSHFMFFNVLSYFQHFFRYRGGGGGVKKINVFFLENQFFLIMLSSRFRLFQKPRGGGE